MERVTTTAPDGSVGLVVAPDGTASIAYGESGAAAVARDGHAGRLDVHEARGRGGTGTHAIARAANGSLHVAFGVDEAGKARIAYATNAGGGWVVTPIGASSSVTRTRTPRSPSTRPATPTSRSRSLGTSPDRTSIEYATNRTGAWVLSKRTTGAPRDLDPIIAVDAAGHPRIAFLRAGVGRPAARRPTARRGRRGS